MGVVGAIEPNTEAWEYFVYLPLVMKAGSGGSNPGAISGIVYNVLTDLPLEGASVCIGSNCKTTGSDGYYIFEYLSPGVYTLRASKTSYIILDQVATVYSDSTTTLNFYLSPFLGPLDLRIVLTWSNVPSYGGIDNDMDAYLWVPKTGDYETIYWFNPGNCDTDPPKACLEQDSQNGPGPETIHLNSLAGTYHYAVNYYADLIDPGGIIPPITQSQAKVEIYLIHDSEDLLIATYNVPASGYDEGDTWWHVFQYTSQNYQFTAVNDITNAPPLEVDPLPPLFLNLFGYKK